MAVGQAVAAKFANAIALGIPLDEMPGVDAYLQRIVASSPQVDGLALLDGAGQTIASTRQHVTGTRFPVGDGTVAALVVAPESPLLDAAVRQIRIALALAAVFAGGLAGGMVAFHTRLRQEPARQRLLDDLDRVEAGDFDVAPMVEERGPLADVARALSACLARVHTARRGLLEAVATIRAIDFDGSLGRQVDAILRPLEDRYRFARSDETAEAPSTSSDGAWRAALVAGLYFAAFPYVANFAVDREPAWPVDAWIPVVPLLVELAAAVAGAALAATRAGRSGIALAAACLVLAAGVGGTYWCREYEPFVALRAATGLAGGFAVAALLLHRPCGLTRKDLVTLMIFAALFAGPLASGIYAEAIGRRSGFLLLGMAILAASPFVVAGGAASRHRVPAGRFGGFDLQLALATLPAAAMTLMVLPGGIGYDDYMFTGAAVAVMGVVALAAPPMGPLGCGLALVAGALAIAFPVGQPVLSTFLACATLGFAAGAGAKAAAPLAGRPWASLAAGAAVALLATGLADSLGTGFAAVPVLAAVALAAVALLVRSAALPARA
jgi:MFS family permease